MLMLRRFLAILVFAALVAGCTSVPVSQDFEPITDASLPADSDETTPTATATPTPVAAVPKPTPKPEAPKPAPPKLINLSVPFATQTPLAATLGQAAWDDLHNEACEEASILMAQAYAQKTKVSPPQVMEDKILDLVAWEEANGYSVDTTAEQTATIARDRLGLDARTSTAVSVAGIRAELAQGNLVIVPAAGRRLGNPNFRRPGPLYHMLVIRGHDPARDEFITNDPGTRKGENYRYRTSVLLNAVHDWPKPGKTKDDVTDAEMDAGAKVMIIVEAKN